jgi:hypothetical protein
MEERNNLSHYYGDVVRRLFLAVALIMIVGLPFISDYLSVAPVFSILGVIVLGLAAALTSPALVWESVLNVVISTVGFVIFEIQSVKTYHDYGLINRFFIINLVLGLLFLFALYFGVKTLRGALLEKRNLKPTVIPHPPMDEFHE